MAISCPLRHGIELTITVSSVRLSIADVAAFLAEAMEHFKHHRDGLKTDVYAEGSFSGQMMKGRKKLGECRLTGPNSLTAALWTDAVIDAYSHAITVEEMQEELAQYRQIDDGSMRDVLNLIETSQGDLRALRLMLQRSREKEERLGHMRRAMQEAVRGGVGAGLSAETMDIINKPRKD